MRTCGFRRIIVGSNYHFLGRPAFATRINYTEVSMLQRNRTAPYLWLMPIALSTLT